MFLRFKTTDDRQQKTDDLQSKVSNLQSEIKCPLCGKTFRADETMACAACSVAKKCGLVMCPRCNYEFAV